MGRFGRQVTIELLARAGRRAILGLHARDKPLGAAVDLDVVAAVTAGFSGADLAALLNEATLLAARWRFNTVDAAVVEETMERMMLGARPRSCWSSANPLLEPRMTCVESARSRAVSSPS